MSAADQAWVVDGAFGLDHLTRGVHPVTEPGPGQVELAVRAVSLNYRDLLMVTGRYDPRQALPLVPCSDAVATVRAVGDGVRRVAVGDRVCPIFAQRWLAGTPDRAARRSTLGGPLHGTLRSRMVVDAEAVVRVPEHLTDAEAATLPCAGVTAWRALVTEGRIRAGDRVLTLGTGGVSLFALQIARMHGARVVITSSQDAKLERARALGAEVGLNYATDPSWGKAAAEALGEGGVDLVVEVGGADTLAQSLRAVRTGGTIALIGVLSGTKTSLQLTRVLMRGIRVQGVFVGDREDLQALCRALAAHPEVRPAVDRVFGFDAVPQAFEHLAAGRHMGKVVVAVDPEATR